MRLICGNIWDYAGTHTITITTNIGWTRSGLNPMGRGIALAAKQRYPELPRWYGWYCQEHKEGTPVTTYADLVLFPTKPLNPLEPWLSWKSPASLELIERGLQQLVELPLLAVAIPLLGCNNGWLTQSAVLPLMSKYLKDDRFVLIDVNLRLEGTNAGTSHTQTIRPI